MSEDVYPPQTRIQGTVYCVVKLLGRGGMGNVYDVEDTTVGKRYVLKTLTPSLVGRQDLARRMDAEARVLARLNHPNIVEVITAGQTQDALNLPYLVMERLNGQTLRTVLEKKGALDLHHAYRIAIDLLDALEHAHEHGVIHRDVKPDNVFLHRMTTGTTITKLLDFGIMRLVDSKNRETRGRFVGTMRYAAPEQILARDILPAADIYATGLVLYEMIAGRGPFDEIDDLSRLAEAHVSKAAPKLSTFARVPIELDALLEAALAKDPKTRPKDAFTFAGQLRRLLQVSVDPVTSSVPTALSPLNTNVEASVPETERDTRTQRQGEGLAYAATQASPQALPPDGAAGALDRQGVAVADVTGRVPKSTLASPGAVRGRVDPAGVDRAAPTRSLVQEPLPAHASGDTMRIEAPDLKFANERAPEPTNEPVARTQPVLGGDRSSTVLMVAVGVVCLAGALGLGLYLGRRESARVAAEAATLEAAPSSVQATPSLQHAAASVPQTVVPPGPEASAGPAASPGLEASVPAASAGPAATAGPTASPDAGRSQVLLSGSPRPAPSPAKSVGLAPGSAGRKPLAPRSNSPMGKTLPPIDF